MDKYVDIAQIEVAKYAMKSSGCQWTDSLGSQ